MPTALVDERCTLGAVRDIDLKDHLARYRFALPCCTGQTVLDIACGTGYGTDMLRTVAASVTGVDVDPDAVEHARAAYGGRFLVSSMVDFSDGVQYDRIVSFETIEHVADYHTALTNLRRLLKPGGQLILSTPNRIVNSPHLRSMHEKPRNLYHVREFSVEELQTVVRAAGFAVDATYGQKQRRPTRQPALRLLYGAANRLGLFPTHFSDRVLPLRPGLEPRYTVLVCV